MIELKAKKLSAAQMVPTVKLVLRSTPRSSSAGRGAGEVLGTCSDSLDFAGAVVPPFETPAAFWAGVAVPPPVAVCSAVAPAAVLAAVPVSDSGTAGIAGTGTLSALSAALSACSHARYAAAM